MSFGTRFGTRFIATIGEALTEAVFPPRCAGCGSPDRSPCARCLGLLVPLGQVAVDGLDQCFAALEYDDLSRRFVAQLKYGGTRAGVPWLGAAMVATLNGFALDTAGTRQSAGRWDAVTWVPAARRNRRHRGFDQAEALARRVARSVGTPPRRLLRRSDVVGQTGRSRADRHRGPTLYRTRPCRGWRVLVVDDVLTTGASMRAAARELRAAGAVEVVGVVAAHRRFR